MLIAFLAAVKSGRPYVPIDISIPAQRVERIIATAGAALVLTPDEVAELLAGRRRPRSAAAAGRRRRIRFTSFSPRAAPVSQRAW